jgi:hypothetical protein
MTRSELILYYNDYIIGLSLDSMQQRDNIVGTHSLSLTLRECLAHKYLYAQYLAVG